MHLRFPPRSLFQARFACRLGVVRFPAQLCIALAILLGAGASPLVAAPPRAARKPVTTNYHGVIVTDDYLWLENGSDPAVRKWVQGQNSAARDYLDKLSMRAATEYQLRKLLTDPASDYFNIQARAGKVFALKAKPPAPQPSLILRTSATNAAGAKVILDPSQAIPGHRMSIDFYEASPDGQWVAVSLSEEGSASGTLRIYESATGRELPDVPLRAHSSAAGGSVAWAPAGAGIYYTRYPAPEERSEAEAPVQIWFHKMGTPAAGDRYEIGREFPLLGKATLKSSPDHRYVLASVAEGNGGEWTHWLRNPAGQWQEIASPDDQVERIEFGRDPIYIEWPADDSLYLLSRKQAPKGRILRLPLNQLDLAKAREVIKEGRKTIAGFVPSASGVYLEELDGGPAELRFHDFYAKGAENDEPEQAAANEPDESIDPADPADAPEDPDEDDKAEDNLAAIAGTNGASETPTNAATNAGNNDPRSESGNDRRRDGRRGSRREWSVPLRGLFSVPEMVCLHGDDLLFRTEGFVTQPKWQLYHPRDRDHVHAVALGTPAAVDFVDVEVVRDFALSKDGTKVPMNIIRHRGTRLDGQNPTLLIGYGGFGVSLSPRFEISRRVWLDQGGIVAVANLRGGGEYGADWHQAGSGTNKQHVFDDFIACAEFLIRSNYTNPGKLALEGEGQGGLLAAAALIQRPDLFRAVVAESGPYDLLRFEADPIGAFNTPELGSVRNAGDFRALFAASPYHHVAKDAVYPAILLRADENAGRAGAGAARKWAARLQEATASKNPILLQTSAGNGPSNALNERLARLVDLYSFLFEQLGIEYSEIARGPWSGAVTTNSALVRGKLLREGLPVRLALSASPLLTRPIFTSAVRSDSVLHNLVSFPLEKLQPDTQYYYALEVAGRIERTKRGQFRTFPAGPASFSFAYASCARSASTSTIFDTIRENHPLFYMNIGDFHYEDIAVNDPGRFRAAYDFVLSSPQQADLYRSTPLIYIWDDHDYGGNNANRRARSHNAARATYDEYAPHYPLPVGGDRGPICQTFNVGRVKFILTDLRSERDSITNRDDATKSMMGPAQKEWFKKELLEANGKYPLICWVSSVPWIGTKGSNYYRIGTNVFGYIHHTNLVNSLSARINRTRSGRPPGSEEDHWSAFATERREIADFIKSNHIQGVCILHGDSHMLAADDGSNSDYATGGGAPLPVMCAAPLDREPSIKGGPYSQGIYRVNDRKGEGAFGFVTITDRGGDIQVRYSGRNRWNEEKISLQFTVPAAGAGSPLNPKTGEPRS